MVLLHDPHVRISHSHVIITDSINMIGQKTPSLSVLPSAAPVSHRDSMRIARRLIEAAELKIKS